ncbi:MAG: hypothetical protein AAB622_00705 [Patescibacteria group bacterium]
MAVKLNLLPQGAVVSGGLGKTLKSIKSFGIIALGIFLFFILGVSGFLVYSSIKLTGLSTQEESLKARIKSQESREQRIVLIKDRLARILKVQSTPSVQKNLNKIEGIVASLPEGTVLTELSLDLKKTDLSLIFKSGSDLNNFLGSVKTKSEFKRASLTAFSFNPLSGYSVGLRFFEN